MPTVAHIGFMDTVPASMKLRFMRDAEKCGDAGEAAQDEPDPNGYFSERDEVRPKIRVRDEGSVAKKSAYHHCTSGWHAAGFVQNSAVL